MKKKTIFALLTTTTALLASSVILVNNYKTPVKADEEKTTHNELYYMVGSFNGWDPATAIQLEWDETANKYTTTCDFEVTKNEKDERVTPQFKILKGAKDWDHQLSLHDGLFQTYGETLAFRNQAGEGNENIQVCVSGKFSIGLNEGSTYVPTGDGFIWFAEPTKIYVESYDINYAFVYSDSWGIDWRGWELNKESDPYYYEKAPCDNLYYMVGDKNWSDVNLIFSSSYKDRQSETLEDFDFSTQKVLSFKDKEGTDLYEVVYEEDKLSALEFVQYWRTIRHDGSICYLLEDNKAREEVINKYDSLADEAKSHVKNVSDYDTYTISNTISFLRTPEALSFDRIGLLNSNSNNQDITFTVVLVSLASLTLLSFGAFYTFKKRNRK